MTNLKVWWIVAYDRQYPEGGLDDVKECFHTREDALVKLNYYKSKYDVAKVVNVSRELGWADD